VAKKAEATASLHLIALPLLPGPWGFILAPYAAIFLFTVPVSVYGPYLADEPYAACFKDFEVVTP